METLDEILKRLNARNADINKRFTSSEYIANEEANELFASTEQDFNRARRLNNIEKALATQNYIKNAYKANPSALDYPDLTRITTIADDAKRYEKIRDFEFGKLENSLKYLKNLEIIAQKERDLNNSYSLAKAKMNQWKKQRAEQLNEEAYQRAANALGLLDLKSKQKQWDDLLSLEQDIGTTYTKYAFDKADETHNSTMALNKAETAFKNADADYKKLLLEQGRQQVDERNAMYDQIAKETGLARPQIFTHFSNGGIYRNGNFRYPEEMVAEANSLLGSNGSNNSNSSNSNSSSNTTSNSQSTSSNNQSNTDASASLAKSSKSLYDNGTPTATRAPGAPRVTQEILGMLHENKELDDTEYTIYSQSLKKEFDLSLQPNEAVTNAIVKDAKTLSNREFTIRYNGLNKQVFLDRVNKGNVILYKQDPTTGEYTIPTDVKMIDNISGNRYREIKHRIKKDGMYDGSISNYTDSNGKAISADEYFKTYRNPEILMNQIEIRYSSNPEAQGNDFRETIEQLKKGYEIDENDENYDKKKGKAAQRIGKILYSAKAKACISLFNMLFPGVDLTYNKNLRDTLTAMIEDPDNIEFAKIVKKLDDEKLSHTDRQNLKTKFQVIQRAMKKLNINNDNPLLKSYGKAIVKSPDGKDLTNTYMLPRITPKIIRESFNETLNENRIAELVERREKEKKEREKNSKPNFFSSLMKS
ncbi:hypothetical protein KDE12_00120 [Campylobacter sp. faydin G-105]|uniref:hypothetical protein n=1 Tax=Campylobacter anatolicus TaxID=2829105 RepID=UPI001B93DA05|nr:hypothetical protein [Campylobacter anatolicus]MBR8461260.1 hypothetical protein [Campylobacter anatolicus]